MARYPALLLAGICMCVLGQTTAKSAAVGDVPRTLPRDLRGRAAALARELNTHDTTQEDNEMQFGDEVDGYDAEDLGDEDSLMGDIDQMDDLEELQSIYDDYMDEEGDVEQNFAHKDATDEEYLKSLQDTNFDESMDGVDKDADGKYDMSDFLGDDGDDGEREQDEVQDSVLDQYAIHNDDAMDFMSDADQEYNERSEPVVAEEQLRNDNVMPNYSPKNF